MACARYSAGCAPETANLPPKMKHGTPSMPACLASCDFRFDGVDVFLGRQRSADFIGVKTDIGGGFAPASRARSDRRPR